MENSNNKIFVDANVLIFLFCPIGNASKSKTDQYSKQLQEFIIDGREMYIDIIILSELINRWLRINLKPKHPKNFKQSLKSSKGQKIYKNILDNVKKNVISLFKIVNTSYESLVDLPNLR